MLKKDFMTWTGGVAWNQIELKTFNWNETAKGGHAALCPPYIYVIV